MRIIVVLLYLIDWHNRIGEFSLDHPNTKSLHEVIKLV